MTPFSTESDKEETNRFSLPVRERKSYLICLQEVNGLNHRLVQVWGITSLSPSVAPEKECS